MPTHAAPRHGRTGDARARAADVLVRVELDGAFAAPALSAAIDREPALATADRALATELVYGALRCSVALDARLQRHAPRAGSIAKLDPYTRAVLRIAAYQILALERIPPRAAVHSAVEALKRGRSPALAGFGNALLRKLAAERPEPLPADARVALALASVPPRVMASVAAVLGGPDDALGVFRAALSRPWTVGLRANTLRASRDEIARRIAAEMPGSVATPGVVSPLALNVSGGGGDPARTQAYREGLFATQEEGAQCVALASGAAPGMRVLDACAGRGGKTGALAAMMAGRGMLHAAEMYPEKVARIREELVRLGLLGEGLVFEGAATDLTRGLGALASRVPPEGYDVVVVDAPCTGLGTIARRPDILARPARIAATSDGEDLVGADGASPRAELPALQRAILERVAPLVRRGGVLLYAVCTLTREEGPDVIAALRAAHPEFVPAEGGGDVPERLRPAQIVLRPDVDGTDGFMVFRLRREGSA